MEKGIELEKKYLFKEGVRIDNLINILGLDIKDMVRDINIDTYYDLNNILEEYQINVRKRELNNTTVYTVKRKIDNNITKRYEINFDSLEEVINFLRGEWQITIKTFEEKLVLKTERKRFNYRFLNSLMEIGIDRVRPVIEKEEDEEFLMVECELKEGREEELYLFHDYLEKFNILEECNLSKKEMALKNRRGRILKK